MGFCSFCSKETNDLITEEVFEDGRVITLCLDCRGIE